MQALLIFLVALLVLLRASAPGLTFEDCGELAAAAAVWGVPHPPGYPLLTMVGGAFVRVGDLFGLEAARSMVLLSAVSAAGAVALVARFVERAARRLGGGERTRSVVPLAVAGLLVLSPTFRAQGLVVEAYALAAFCNAALLLAALCWRPAFVGLWFGLAVAAHPSGVFLFPLAVFGILREGRGAASVGRGAAGFALGSTTWLYVPLAAAAKPAVNWGGIEGIDGLLDHLLRRQFGVTPERDLAAQAGFVAEHLVGQWPLVLVLALVVGGVLTRRASAPAEEPADGPGPSALGPALGLVGVTLLVTTLGLFWAQHWPVTEELTRVRLAGSFTPLVLLSAAAVGLLLERGRERGAALVARPPQAVLLLLVLVLAMVQVAPTGRPTLADFTDMSGVTEAQTYAAEVLTRPEPGEPRAVVINRLGYSDVLFFPLLYTKVVDGLGEGLLVVDRELLGAAWYRAELAAERPDLGPALDELGAAIDGAPADPRSRRLAQVPFLLWLAGHEGGLAYVGKPGPRLVEGRWLSADERWWVVSAEPRVTTVPGPNGEGASRPWLDRTRPYDVWRAELLREAEERDAFRREAAAP